MRRKFLQSITIKDHTSLADDIMNGLNHINANYLYDVYEDIDEHGCITQVRIDIFIQVL